MRSAVAEGQEIRPGAPPQQREVVKDPLRLPWPIAAVSVISAITFSIIIGNTVLAWTLSAATILAAVFRGRVAVPRAVMLPLALVLALAVFANLTEVPQGSSLMLGSGYTVGVFVGTLLVIFMAKARSLGEAQFTLFLAMVWMMLAGLTIEPFPYVYLVAVQAVFLALALRSLSGIRVLPPVRDGGLRLPLATVVLLLFAVALAQVLRFADSAFNLMGPLLDPPLYTSRAFSPRTMLSSIRDLQGSDRVLAHVISREADNYMVGRRYVRYKQLTWEAESGKHGVQPTTRFNDIFADEGTRFPVTRVPLADTWRPQMVDEVVLAGGLSGNLFVPQDAAVVSARLSYITQDDYDVLFTPVGVPFSGQYFVARGNVEPPPVSATDNLQLEACRDIQPEIRAYAEPLALEATAKAASDRQRASFMEAWFHKNYKYSRGMEFQPGDFLREFLVQKTPAHCEFFASGMVVMLRSLGIPARYVTGFLVFEKNDLGGWYVVREQHAHAWVEAWIDGAWTRYDPTPPGSTGPRERSYPRLRAWLDYVGFHWDRFKAGLDGLSPREILQRAMNGVLGLGRWLIEQPMRLILLLAIFAAEQLFRKQDAWGRRWLRSRLSRRATAVDVEEDATVRRLRMLMERFDAALRKRGLERPPHLTLHEFARTEAGAPHMSFLDAYAQARYAGGSTDVDALEHAVATLEKPVKAGAGRGGA